MHRIATIQHHSKEHRISFWQTYSPTLFFIVVLLAGMSFSLQSTATTIISAQSGNWTSTATWNPPQVPTLSDSVTITGGHTIVVNDMTTHHVASLTIRTNAILEHAANDTVESKKLILHVAGNLIIEQGGRINANGRGYKKNAPLWVPNDYAGGSYGGQGGNGTKNLTYGSPVAPTNIGANGGSDYWYSQGGGAIIITVDGNTTNNGLVSANGENRGYSGGAGGSVYLTTATLSGTGTIQANGGATNNYGCGGGGRIAVILTAGNNFGNVKFQAYGGYTATGKKGGAGTVYLQTAAQGPGKGTLIIDNNDYATLAGAETVVPSGTTWGTNLFATLILTNNGIIGIWTGATFDVNGLTVTDDPSGAGEGFRLWGGTFKTPLLYAFAHRLWIASASIFTPNTLIVQSNGILQLEVPCSLGTMVIQGGGTATHTANTTNEAYKFILTATNNLTIETNGSINVDGKGYQSGGGPYAANHFYDGGSYGGRGGHGTVSPVYGSILAPTNCGAGGAESAGRNAPGGGVVRLLVYGTTTVHGVISANGIYGSWPGGAGGSVYITTGTLQGNGIIRANGGTAPTYGCGGGGRISVVLTSGANFDHVSMQAYGGSNPSYSGGAGTIYRQTASQSSGNGIVTVDNDNRPLGTGAGTNEIPPTVNPVVNELAGATLLLTNTTVSRVTADVRLGNLFVYTGSTLDLRWKTITVNSSKHNLGGGTTNNPGVIIWKKTGTVFLVL